MLTFAKIAGGAPSRMSPMTKHMLTPTVPREVADLARYYEQGMEVGEDQAKPRQDMHPIVAKRLGIDPEKPVTFAQINALLSGRRADGEKIEGKTYSEFREYTDPKTGERKEKVPIGSVDFCLTPDKSVSVAWAFATGAEQAAIYAAHRDAAQDAMLYVEDHMAKAGKGKGGKDGYDQGHLGWISFDHYTSRPTLWIAREEDGKTVNESITVPFVTDAKDSDGRNLVTENVPIKIAGDPELHTHFTVTNAVFCENGRVGSMDLDRLDGFVKEAGALYQAFLSKRLQDLGAEVVLDKDTGAARLPAIPDEVRTLFSKRTVNGEQAARDFAKSQGLDWDDLSPERRAALLKKGVQGIPKGLDGETIGKLKKDDMADFQNWKKQAEELGWKHETIIQNQRPIIELDRAIRQDRAYQQGIEWLEKELDKRAVISEHDVRAAIARGFIGNRIESSKDLDRMTETFLDRGVRQQGEITPLIMGRDEEKRVRSVTTGLHEMQEKEFITKAKRASADMGAALSKESIDAAVKRSGLEFKGEHGEAQLKAIYEIGQGGKLGVMIGAAGAGKTTLLKPLVSAWQEDGRRVHGLALAWRQADDLLDAGIKRDDTPRANNDAKAISVFMNAVQKGDVVLDNKSVVVVDELSLLGTKQGLELLRLQDKHDLQLVMIGDDKQCQSIEAGPIIDLARKALGEEKIPEILTTVRQKTEREKQIVGHFRAGEAGKAVAMKREDKTIEMVPGGYREASNRVAAMVADRLKANLEDPKFRITVSAPTNADAHKLSMAIRETRRQLGQIEKKDLVTIKAAGLGDKGAYDMKLAKGDRVRLFKSVSPAEGRGALGRNGSVLTVVDANKEGVTLRTSEGRDGYVPWERLVQDGKVRLAYGEVMTTHTAQGSTAQEHIYALPSGTRAVNGFSGYSSATRHTLKSYMVLSEGAERDEVKSRRPVNDPRPIEEKDLWGNVARNLSYQPTKSTATDFLDRALDVKRGSARALQQGLQPSELRERRGEEPTTIHTIQQRRQDAHDLRRVTQRLQSIGRDMGPVMEQLEALGPRINAAVEKSVEQAVRATVLDGTYLRPIKAHPQPEQRKDAEHVPTSHPRQKLYRATEKLSPEYLAELKRSVSLTHMVSQTVKLDRQGKGLCPFHNEKTPSFQVDEKKGHFHCFGCGAHGDSIKWLTDARGLSFRDAVDFLGGKSGKELPAPQISKAAGKENLPEWIAVQPIPSNVPPLVGRNGWTAEVYNPRAEERGAEKVQKAYRPQHIAEYRDAQDRKMGYVLRVEMSDGGKFTPQVTWAVPANAPAGADPAKVGRWTIVPMQNPRPLYRGEEIAKNPNKLVIVVMGEKKADILQKELGNSVVVVSWAGGDNGRAYTDFSALKDRNVIIWPDADHGGKAAAVGEIDRHGQHKPGVADYLKDVGAKGVKVIVPPADAEKGWDAGDLIKSGANRQIVKEFIQQKAVSVDAAKKSFSENGNVVQKPEIKNISMRQSRSR